MTKNDLPFYARTTVLDKFLKQPPDPQTQQEVLEILLEAIKKEGELRRYFFRQGPSPKWAQLLWDYGFFADPPAPMPVEGGYRFPWWDVQEYLVSIANEVPNVVRSHITTLKAHPWIHLRALDTVKLTPPDVIATLIPYIVEWFKREDFINWIQSNVSGIDADTSLKAIIDVLVSTGHGQSALDLFKVVIKPLAPRNPRKFEDVLLDDDAIALFDLIGGEQEFITYWSSVVECGLTQSTAILEDHIRTALRIQAEMRGRDSGKEIFWWRETIEGSAETHSQAYKDKLFALLRYVLEEIQARFGPTQFTSQIERFLRDELVIFRRLALYLIARSPKDCSSLVQYVLSNTIYLHDSALRREFLRLLHIGYAVLTNRQQEGLLAMIARGPDEASTQIQLNLMHELSSRDSKTAFIKKYTDEWILDRLLLINETLPEKFERLRTHLSEQYGEREPLSDSTFYSEAYFIEETSPLDGIQLAHLTPEELLNFIQTWEEPTNEELGPKRISWGGLGTAVARYLLTRNADFNTYIVDIMLAHPSIAYQYFSQVRAIGADATPSWEQLIHIIERLLERNETHQENWNHVRRELVHFLNKEVSQNGIDFSLNSLVRVRNILLQLLDDPDPTQDAERPPKGWIGHNDPAHIAFNHVRPLSLRTLILYAHRVANLALKQSPATEKAGPGPSRLEPIVRDALTRKLSRSEDPSPALHSIYGFHLPILYWLDKSWTEAQIDQIFPSELTETSTELFRAAWDSYVVFNPTLYIPLFDAIKSKYERAIELMKQKDLAYKHRHPDENLASHLISDYLNKTYDIRMESGRKSLLARFFEAATPNVRGNAIWQIWKFLEQENIDTERYWMRVRPLWEWRNHEASRLNYPEDFGKEMLYFSCLPKVMRHTETIITLWPLLEGIIPYLVDSPTAHTAWTWLEEYLILEVERNPLKTIAFYRLMIEAKAERRFHSVNERMHRILEQGAKLPVSRYETLKLIDLLAYYGDYNYTDIYNEYS